MLLITYVLVRVTRFFKCPFSVVEFLLIFWNQRTIKYYVREMFFILHIFIKLNFPLTFWIKQEDLLTEKLLKIITMLFRHRLELRVYWLLALTCSIYILFFKIWNVRNQTNMWRSMQSEPFSWLVRIEPTTSPPFQVMLKPLNQRTKQAT